MRTTKTYVFRAIMYMWTTQLSRKIKLLQTTGMKPFLRIYFCGCTNAHRWQLKLVLPHALVPVSVTVFPYSVENALHFQIALHFVRFQMQLYIDITKITPTAKHLLSEAFETISFPDSCPFNSS